MGIEWSSATIDAFLELEESRQQELFSTIKNLPVAITDLVVNDKKFYLTHGCYSELEKEGTLYLKDIDDPILFVWQRVDPNEVSYKIKFLLPAIRYLLIIMESMKSFIINLISCNPIILILIVAVPAIMKIVSFLH